MTVAEAGTRDGLLLDVVSERALDTDTPVILFAAKSGKVNPDLTVGVDVTNASELKSNAGLGHDGVKLHGTGFIISKAEALHFGLGDRSEINEIIKPYRNGMDIAQKCKDRFVIDAFGLESDQLKSISPAIYQHLLATVRPEREAQFTRSPTKDAQAYLDLWWIFGKPRQELRPAIKDLDSFIATVDTAKHRVFQFLPSQVICVDKIVIIASQDALGVLSSRIHLLWSLRAGGWLGVGNDSVYTKTRTFDPFPFPDATDVQKTEIGAIAEELDAHRKRVLDAHPHLTLTGLYNVLERLKAGARPDDLTDKERVIFDDGLVLILKELHDKLDVAVAEAYGWPADLAEEEVLARLVALNKERAREEAQGHVRWLRPDYQIPRFGSAAEKAELELDLGDAAPAAAAAGPKPAFPKSDADQTLAVIFALQDAQGPLSVDEVAAAFRKGKTVRASVAAVLASLHRVGRLSFEGGRYGLRLAA
jgi:hypothetical protein